MRYIIAYDICQPRRLRRVARCLEKHALRVQKSVFVYEGTADDLGNLLDAVAELIEASEDCVHAWRTASQQPRLGISRGTSPYVYPASAVLGSSANVFINGSGT